VGLGLPAFLGTHGSEASPVAASGAPVQAPAPDTAAVPAPAAPAIPAVKPPKPTA
ncbi:MAG: hypothetical protein RLZZ34_2277, partial [Verrucomicrobiota bacterium]